MWPALRKRMKTTFSVIPTAPVREPPVPIWRPVKRELVAQQLEVAEYYLTKMKDADAAVFCYQEVASKGSINPAAAARAKARLKELRVTSR